MSTLGLTNKKLQIDDVYGQYTKLKVVKTSYVHFSTTEAVQSLLCVIVVSQVSKFKRLREVRRDSRLTLNSGKRRSFVRPLESALFFDSCSIEQERSPIQYRTVRTKHS